MVFPRVINTLTDFAHMDHGHTDITSVDFSHWEFANIQISLTKTLIL